MKVFSLPSFDDAQRDFFLRFLSPPLLLASPTPLTLFSWKATVRYSAKKLKFVRIGSNWIASAERALRNLEKSTISYNDSSPSRLESFPFDAMLFPLLVVFIASVKFFARIRSLAFAAAIARALAFGPADTEVEIEWNRLLKSVRRGWGSGAICWAIEWTVVGWARPESDAERNWVICACWAAVISIRFADVVGGVWLLRWWDLERLERSRDLLRFLQWKFKSISSLKNIQKMITHLSLSLDLSLRLDFSLLLRRSFDRLCDRSLLRLRDLIRCDVINRLKKWRCVKKY